MSIAPRDVGKKRNITKNEQTITKKQILTASLGNTLEWFDFGMFVYFAPIIGEKFFPSSDISSATRAALTVFAVGFICRPLGGILFGHAGDTYGRAKTLRISILIITLSTLCIGLLPDYQTIGIAAPIIFTLLRLLQGISIGGEYSGVMIYLAESAPPSRRGFVTSFAATGANIGFLGSTLALFILNNHLSTSEVNEWGWRIPFILTSIIGSIIVYYRFKLRETPIFSALQYRHQLARHPFLDALNKAPTQLLKIVGLTSMGSALYYLFFGYMPTYIKQYDSLNNDRALEIQGFFLVSMLFIVPLAGWCGDYFGRKRVLICTSIGIICIALPALLLLQNHTMTSIILGFTLATLLSCFDQGNTLTAVVENCPANIRYSGIAFAYNIGIALFGGTAPLIATVLTQHVSAIAPGYYLIVMAIISLITATTLLSKRNMQRYMQTS